MSEQCKNYNLESHKFHNPYTPEFFRPQHGADNTVCAVQSWCDWLLKTKSLCIFNLCIWFVGKKTLKVLFSYHGRHSTYLIVSISTNVWLIIPFKNYKRVIMGCLIDFHIGINYSHMTTLSLISQQRNHNLNMTLEEYCS